MDADRRKLTSNEQKALRLIETNRPWTARTGVALLGLHVMRETDYAMQMAAVGAEIRRRVEDLGAAYNTIARLHEEKKEAQRAHADQMEKARMELAALQKQRDEERRLADAEIARLLRLSPAVQGAQLAAARAEIEKLRRTAETLRAQLAQRGAALPFSGF